MFGNTPNQGQNNSLFGGGGGQSTGGIFGGGNANMGNPNQGGSIFGGATKGGFGSQQTGGGGLFGQPNSNSGGGIFGNVANQQQQQSGNLFGGGISNQPQQGAGTGLFGAPQNQQNSMFGQGQSNQSTAFGANKTGTGLFGGGINAQQTQPAFGQAQNTSNLFGQPQVNQGIFGQTTQPSTGGGIFGNQQPQQQGQQGLFPSSFNAQSNQPQTQQSLFNQQPTGTANLFGGNQQKPTGLFGNTNPQQTSTGGMFGQQAPSTATSMFGQQQNTNTWGVQQQQQPTTSTWGQNTTAFNTSTTNQLGGTSWGVNTALGQPQGNLNQPLVTAVKSKNPKVDSKHTVKCIAALDNYTGMSKQQIRCHYILTGGAPQQQPQTVAGGMSFGNNASTLFNKPVTNQAPTSFGQIGGQPSQTTGSLFGGQSSTNSSLFGGTKPSGSIFGAQSTTPSLFGGGNQQPQTSSLFGQPPVQQQQLFGATQNVQPQSTLFGTQPVQSGGNSLFGGQTNTQQTSSLFTNTQPQQSSLFSSPNTNQTGGSSLFGTNTGSLFGNTTGGNQPATSLFGSSQPQSQPQQSFFGNQISQPAPHQNNTSNSLFSSATPNILQNQQPSYSPYASNLNMLSSFPLQSSILANQAILDPNYNKNGNNMLAVVLSALVSGGAISKNDADKLLKPTPFDELVRRRKQEVQKQKQQQSLFSDIPSVFDDPTNFKRFQVPDDYFQMRRTTGYWSKQKEKQQNDRKKFSVVYAPKRNRQRPVTRTLRDDRDDISRVTQKQRAVAKHQLPMYDQNVYSLKPSMMRITMMSISDIKNVQGVEIKSKFGKIRFLQPVSLLNKQIHDCVQIKQDTINIIDDQWQNKRCELTFYNFAKYTQKSEKQQQKIQAKMKKWIQKNLAQKMQLKEFDKSDGTLIVTIN